MALDQHLQLQSYSKHKQLNQLHLTSLLVVEKQIYIVFMVEQQTDVLQPLNQFKGLILSSCFFIFLIHLYNKMNNKNQIDISNPLYLLVLLALVHGLQSSKNIKSSSNFSIRETERILTQSESCSTDARFLLTNRSLCQI